PAINGLAITVPPDSEVTEQAVRAAAAPAVRGGLLAVNLAAVRERVEALPWVRHAEVRRLWPHALAITVQAERPVARWGNDSLMDDSGRIFTPAAVSKYQDLPALSGPSADATELLQSYAQATTLLAPLGLRVTAFAENARGEVRIVLANGLQVELGRDAPHAMLARFVTVAAPALGTALARAATVDMRYPNGFAVGWKGEERHG
ncbi:MAG: cell division protein FtsQ/DivIB, partial [Gammaproteobacteria bacterium]